MHQIQSRSSTAITRASCLQADVIDISNSRSQT